MNQCTAIITHLQDDLLDECTVSRRIEIVELRDVPVETRIHARTEHQRGIPLAIIDHWIASGVVEYLGTTDDVRMYIQKADCIVLPSYREGTPRTLLEAASSSKPIIATDVPGCHHVVEDNHNGLLCKIKSADDLAEKMEIMSKLDDTTLKTFGENGRRKIEVQFDEKLVIDKYVKELEALRRAV